MIGRDTRLDLSVRDEYVTCQTWVYVLPGLAGIMFRYRTASDLRSGRGTA
jgi:hypothetical protein